MKCFHVEGVTMKKIIDTIYVGTVKDIQFAEQCNYSVLGACKEPLHRKHARLQGASQDGYTGRSMGKEEPEYLYAERDHALYLNLIDARNPKYIPNEVIDKALDFIDKELDQGRKVLIVCNKAESRSPSISLMWIIKNNYFEFFLDKRNDFYTLLSDFTDVIYPQYNPSNGMKLYVKQFWEKYCNERT